jgi:glycosyltransferase involved in cell wall biosynthesis
MKVLLVHSYCFPTGGDWRYVESVYKILKGRGDEVRVFGIRSESGVLPENDDFRLVISKIYLYDKREGRGWRENLVDAAAILFNVRVFRSLNQLLREFSPDVIQLNSVHSALSPSALAAVLWHRVRKKSKVFWRVLDYKLICPNRTLLDAQSIKCTKCVTKIIPYPTLFKRCKNGNFCASMVAFLENLEVNLLLRAFKLDALFAQSSFSAELLGESPLRRFRTVVIPNPIEQPVALSTEGKKYDVVYFGRLSSEKGVLACLPVLARLGLSVAIVGDGPDAEFVTEFSRKHPKIVFFGPLWGERLSAVLTKSAVTIVPSTWYEVSPYVILESYRHGVPVLASDNGGSKDIVVAGVTGEVYESAVQKSFEATLIKMLASIEKYEEGVIKRFVSKNHSEEAYYRKFVSEVSQ